MRLMLRASFRTLERSINPSLISKSSARIAPPPTTPSFFSAITRTTASSHPLSRSSPLLSSLQVRYASHQAQGRANSGSKDSPGKRLGAKKSGEQYVVPGNIIFRQRGTKWFPGENCAMGRDHTIYATESGYVKYYLDPELHPKRRYIGVCFEREGKLPTPRNAPTRRRLNRIAVPRVEPVGVELDVDMFGEDVTAVEGAAAGEDIPNAKANLPLRPGYMYREANWQIGRAAEKAGITAKEFDRENRWMAWRKRQARAQRAAQMKSLKGKKKSSKKGKGR
ncbi:ribosomal L27 protein-domain-containing protein [Talaromyces proteolyticus]|uniref:Large ribosomal subunit protein bL27m n=1 Tax=Talaromyces proteolyticus TaxID=1131652 RepID=A0AAD4KW40_9EURO|nr:ribosomal L27 protein-domain-containing protein [Talaromyces proteolyticus]KAH8702297.1 ribosomal L27 protein-domain-containing protein [Talaromyces proteolyticus]